MSLGWDILGACFIFAQGSFAHHRPFLAFRTDRTRGVSSAGSRGDSQLHRISSGFPGDFSTAVSPFFNEI